MLLMGGGRHLGEARKLINVLRQLYRVGVVRAALVRVRVRVRVRANPNPNPNQVRTAREAVRHMAEI